MVLHDKDLHAAGIRFRTGLGGKFAQCGYDRPLDLSMDPGLVFVKRTCEANTRRLPRE